MSRITGGPPGLGTRPVEKASGAGGRPRDGGPRCGTRTVHESRKGLRALRGGGLPPAARCAPADYTVFDPASEQVGWASGPLIVVGRTDLGVTSAFNFLEDTLVLSGATVTGVDLAPDTGSYNYTLTGLAPPPAPPDTTPPNTRITSAPARVARAGRATFGFRSTERGSTFQCRLDRRAWRRCTSPTTFRRLALGPHTFRVSARDAAGNVDPTPAIRRWLIARPPQSRQRGA
jgi:hypothetical protein